MWTPRTCILIRNEFVFHGRFFATKGSILTKGIPFFCLVMNSPNYEETYRTSQGNFQGEMFCCYEFLAYYYVNWTITEPKHLLDMGPSFPQGLFNLDRCGRNDINSIFAFHQRIYFQRKKNDTCSTYPYSHKQNALYLHY